MSALEQAQIDFIKKHIRLKPNGSYEYRVREDGKDISKSNKDLNTLINIVLGKIKTGSRRKQQSISLLEFSKKFYNLFRAKNKSEKTKEQYDNIIDNHIKSYFDNKAINKINAEELQKFINKIKGDSIRKKVFNFVYSVFEKATALGEIKSNPAIAIELPQNDKKAKKRGLLFDEQIKLIKAVKATNDKDFYLFVLFSLVLGSRREETCNFKLKDINEEKQLIFIHGTKTENAPRWIKISKDMIKLLKSVNKKPNEKYFALTPNGYYHKISRLYKKLKIQNVDVHSLRRTCSTNLYYLGVPDKQRQQIMGHASIVTTNDIYTFLEHDITKEKIEKLYKSLYFSDYK